jgi:hypothetical protein
MLHTNQERREAAYGRQQVLHIGALADGVGHLQLCRRHPGLLSLRCQLLCLMNGDCDLGCQRFQDRLFPPAEYTGLLALHVEYAQQPFVDDQRNHDFRFRGDRGVFVESGDVPLVVDGVVGDDGLSRGDGSADQPEVRRDVNLSGADGLDAAGLDDGCTGLVVDTEDADRVEAEGAAGKFYDLGEQFVRILDGVDLLRDLSHQLQV